MTVRTFQTMLLGALRFADFAFDVRVVRDGGSEGGYFVITGGAIGSAAFRSLASCAGGNAGPTRRTSEGSSSSPSSAGQGGYSL
jgi:hypothetical protein